MVIHAKEEKKKVLAVGVWFERGGFVGVASGGEVFCGNFADEGWGWVADCWLSQVP